MVLEKLAETKCPIHELLRRRWSPRAFADRPVEMDKLLSLLEAARWAPSSYNEQPWRFIVATKDEPAEFTRLLECLVEGNRIWARNAPVLMLSVAKLRFEDDGDSNRHAFHDVGLAVGNLVVQATVLGLAVHQMAGFDVRKARATYGVPEGFEPVAGMALGYPGDPKMLPDKLRERELVKRTRKELVELVYAGQWERPWPPVASSFG